jgi:hypothetical protein
MERGIQGGRMREREKWVERESESDTNNEERERGGRVVRERGGYRGREGQRKRGMGRETKRGRERERVEEVGDREGVGVSDMDLGEERTNEKIEYNKNRDINNNTYI